MADRDLFDTIVGLASALNTLIFLALAIVLAPALYSLARTVRDLRALLDRVYEDLRPFTAHANRIAANLDEISDSVKSEVKDVQQTIAQANEGLSRAVESTQRRISQFGALVDVAQKEAERAFVSTASTVRGVRAGAAAAVRGSRRDNGDDDDADRPARPRVRSRRKRE